MTAPEPTTSEPPNVLTYVSAGNSDDRLSQLDWMRFTEKLLHAVRAVAWQVYGVWYSAPNSRYQDMCVSFALPITAAYGRVDLQDRLTALATEFGQDTVVWAECPETKFLTPW
jgi:hypothetical protein